MFLQTIGSPWSSDDSVLQARYQVGDGLAEPGSLTAKGIEASQSLTAIGGSVSGVLRRNAQSDYEPIMGGVPSTTAPTGVTSEGRMAVIANEPATPWPTDSLPDAPAILEYIATQVLGGAFATQPADASCYIAPTPDVRSQYCNQGLILSSRWDTAVTKLTNLENTPPARFSANGD